MRDGIEIERRFRVCVEFLPPLEEGESITQVYLGFEPVIQVRARRGKWFLTMKSKGLRSRREVEIEIHGSEALTFVEFASPGSVAIRKTRYRVPFGCHVWEVDVFEPPFDGLVLAEVELADPKESVELPPWVGDEVTDDPAYANSNLARSGRLPAAAADEEPQGPEEGRGAADTLVQPGDVLLVHVQEKPAFYARVEEIVPDVKPGWRQVRLNVLTVPRQELRWTLEPSQIDGAPFTMGGTPVHIERVPDPAPATPVEQGAEKQQTRPSGQVITFPSRPKE